MHGGEMAHGRKKAPITLTAAQQAEFRDWLAEAFAFVAAMQEMTPQEFRQLHADAAMGRKMTRKSRVTDAQLVAEERAVRAELREHGLNLDQAAIHLRIGAAFNLASTTVRDRLIRIRHRGVRD